MIAAIGTWLLGSSSTKRKVTYATATVSKGEISESVTATGTIEPVTEVEVGTQVSGIIDKIYVDYNSVVTKGELIAEMDRVTLLTEVESQKATYNGAKAEYEYQKKNYERNKGLHEKQLISDTDYELSLYNYEKAKSTYESCKATLAKAERNLAYATITSPIDGVVISKDVEEGQTVASGFETPTLFTIAADLTQMQVVADVDEADIGGVEEGQRVTFTVDAYPNDVSKESNSDPSGRRQLFKLDKHYFLQHGCDIRGCHFGTESGPEAQTKTDCQCHHIHAGQKRRTLRTLTCSALYTGSTAYQRRRYCQRLQRRTQSMDP